jgi:hypothetical protein
VEYIELFGKDPVTGKDVYEKFKPWALHSKVQRPKFKVQIGFLWTLLFGLCSLLFGLCSLVFALWSLKFKDFQKGKSVNSSVAHYIP